MGLKKYQIQTKKMIVKKIFGSDIVVDSDDNINVNNNYGDIDIDMCILDSS
jgi:hypothetical protein